MKIGINSQIIKSTLTLNVRPNNFRPFQYRREAYTIIPDNFYSGTAEALATKHARERFGVGPETWAILTDHDRKQLCNKISEAA